MLTLSLIIPVYNEERHIGRCLDAVARQTVLPDEVIIVDNNCTDRTIEIAKPLQFCNSCAAAKARNWSLTFKGFRCGYV